MNKVCQLCNHYNINKDGSHEYLLLFIKTIVINIYYRARDENTQLYSIANGFTHGSILDASLCLGSKN